jgi:hypothetical protein
MARASTTERRDQARVIGCVLWKEEGGRVEMCRPAKSSPFGARGRERESPSRRPPCSLAPLRSPHTLPPNRQHQRCSSVPSPPRPALRPGRSVLDHPRGRAKRPKEGEESNTAAPSSRARCFLCTLSPSAPQCGTLARSGRSIERRRRRFGVLDDARKRETRRSRSLALTLLSPLPLSPLFPNPKTPQAPRRLVARAAAEDVKAATNMLDFEELSDVVRCV